MNPLSKYIRLLPSDSDNKEYESLGYTLYTNPDGITYLAVRPDAPEEAHHLASGASQGDPQAWQEIDGTPNESLPGEEE
jgi:hypothetical protein